MNAKAKTKSRPHQGGSYRRNKDGELERVKAPSVEPTPDHVKKAKKAKAGAGSAKAPEETNKPTAGQSSGGSGSNRKE